MNDDYDELDDLIQIKGPADQHPPVVPAPVIPSVPAEPAQPVPEQPANRPDESASDDWGSDFEVVVKTAAIIAGSERFPVPAGGLAIGSGYGVDIDLFGLTTEEVYARVEDTEGGNVLVVLESDKGVFLNGERLVPGERRPLGPGDTIAVGTHLLHYVPPGASGQTLAPVQAVEAGRIRASKDQINLGRAADSDIVLDHPTVAIRHARIVRKGAEANIEDTSGGLGLAVNGRRTNRARLQVGDQISIGPFRIVYDGSDFYERAAVGGLPVSAVGVRVDVDTGTILHPTSISLRPGELVAIIGESGAGKSTLLKALAGVSQPTSGRILVGGEDVMQRLPEIGYVPQFDIVHDLLSVREALDYAAQLRLPADTKSGEREARVSEVIEQLRLTERADVRVGLLSGGQRKRTAVGIEIMHKPGALFLDEPTTGLDPGLEKEMMLLFRSLADAGQTVSLVTHATGSLSLCDRAVVMGRGGHLLFDGKPADLLTSFGIESFDELYEEFDRRSREGIVGPQGEMGGIDWGEVAAEPLATRRQPHRKEVQQTLARQTRILTRRYATLLSRDSKHLASAFGQVPILAMFCAFLFHMSVFDKQGDPSNPVPISAGLAALLVFMMVVITVWLGSVNAAREVVKERLVIRREFAIGVQVEAYIASKLIVLFVFVTVQTLLFSAIVLVLRPPHETGAAIIGLVIVLVAGSCVSVLTGLVVSAFSTTEDQAVGLIPLILVPQLLFAGAIVQLEQIPSYLGWLTNFIPTRWSFAAAGHALEMGERIGSDPEASKGTHYGNFFETPTLLYLFIAGAFIAALAWLLAWLLRRNQARAEM